MSQTQATQSDYAVKLQKSLETAEASSKSNNNDANTNYDAAINTYLQIISFSQEQSEDVNKIKEQAIYNLGKLYGKLGRTAELSKLSRDIRPFFDSISKAKTAKIVRTLIDILSESKEAIDAQINLCKESIDWARETKRNFLRQRIETRLAALYLEAKQYQPALELITNLVREVKRLDDKLLLVEIQLIESRLHHALKNIPRSRAALTAARTSANAIYCPPNLQTQLDLQSGILHAEEKDYKTAYSYFYECFEGFNSIDDPRAIIGLKYMLLSKIMVGNPEDVQSITSGKLALRYLGRAIDAMRAVASASSNRSLQDFEEVKNKYSDELAADPIINSHLTELYDTLLEQNLCRIVEPFSVVEIQHIADLIKLPLSVVERKLSQMILDKQFFGILDQGSGQLIVFDEPKEDKTYSSSLSTIENMGKVVDSLYEKTNKLYVAF